MMTLASVTSSNFLYLYHLNTPPQDGAKMLRMPILLSKEVNWYELRGMVNK